MAWNVIFKDKVKFYICVAQIQISPFRWYIFGRPYRLLGGAPLILFPSRVKTYKPCLNDMISARLDGLLVFGWLGNIHLDLCLPLIIPLKNLETLSYPLCHCFCLHDSSQDCLDFSIKFTLTQLGSNANVDVGNRSNREFTIIRFKPC